MIQLKLLCFGLLSFTAASVGAPLAAASDLPPEEHAVLDRANQNGAHMIQAFLAVYEKNGRALRVASQLTACKLGALAEQVRPTKAQVNETVRGYLETAGGVPPIPDYLAIFWSVQAEMATYTVGFNDAASLLSDTEKSSMCQAATKMANDILAGRRE